MKVGQMKSWANKSIFKYEFQRWIKLSHLWSRESAVLWIFQLIVVAAVQMGAHWRWLVCRVLPTPRAVLQECQRSGGPSEQGMLFLLPGNKFPTCFTFKCFKEHGSNSSICKHWDSHLQPREQEHSLPTTPATSVELVGSVQYFVPSSFQVTPLGGISDSKDQLKQ